MKQPLTYAILKYFTRVEEASVDDVMAALRPEYGSYRVFTKKYIEEVLMTDAENFLITKSRVDEDDINGLNIFYKADENQRKIINQYIRD